MSDGDAYPLDTASNPSFSTFQKHDSSMCFLNLISFPNMAGTSRLELKLRLSKSRVLTVTLCPNWVAIGRLVTAGVIGWDSNPRPGSLRNPALSTELPYNFYDTFPRRYFVLYSVSINAAIAVII